MKCRREIGFLLCLLTISFNAISQEKTKNFALTLDLFGNSGLYSVNGEYKIAKINNCQVNVRAGFGYCIIRRDYELEIIGAPIGLNLLTGTKSHHLELGLGASYVKGMNSVFISDKALLESEGIYFVPSIGYRFDKITGGLILKAYYSPFIGIIDFINKEKTLNQINQILNKNYTDQELLSLPKTGEIGTDVGYPFIQNNLGYIGFSIGYRF